MHWSQSRRKVQMITGMLLLVLYFSSQSSVSKMVVGMHIPILVCMDNTYIPSSIEQFLMRNYKRVYPFYTYVENAAQYTAVIEDESTYEKLLELEGTDEDRDTYNDDTAIIDDDLEEAMKAENEKIKNAGSLEHPADEIETIGNAGTFVKATEKSVQYKREDLTDFKNLIGQFYSVDSTTTVGAQQLNADALLGKNMSLTTDNSKPQILIYHTHASEEYVDSTTGDFSTTVVGVGEHLADILKEEYGYNVIHDTGVYDTVRAKAYNVAAPAVEQILKDNPSIEVVIDLHRDQVQEGSKLVMNLNGVPTARFMFFNGLSRTKETGDIDYLYNPYIADNLAFAFQMQVACNEYYPGITRKIYLKGYRYNMHYRAKSLLIELGAQTNTLEEAMRACDPIAHTLYMVLNGEEPSE